MHLAVSQLRRQLVQAMARINTLEMELKRGQKPTANSDDNKSVDSETVSSVWVKSCLIGSVKYATC